MDSIIKLVRDPGWWFTAVFVGILASLTASYFRDVISSRVARVSGVFRARREARLALEQRRIGFLVAHPDLLIMEMVRCTTGVVLFLGVVGCFTSLGLLVDAIEKRPEMKQFGFVNTETFRTVLQLLVLFVGVVAAYVGHRVASAVRIVVRARRDYERVCRMGGTSGSMPRKDATPDGGRE
jgi:hypothetical protein